MNGIITFLGVLVLLSVGRSIFVPVLLAAFIWYLINAIATYYRKALSIRNPFVAGVASMVLSLATFGGLLYLLITQIRPMSAKLMANLPEMQQKLQALISYLGDALGFSVLDKLPDLASAFAAIGASAANFATTAGLVLIFVFFMFIEQSTFGRKVRHLFPEKNKFKKMKYILASIDEKMKKYMFVKTVISAITAVVSYVWLKYLGLEFAGVWAFIIFITSYIPTFGAIIACGLPIVYAMLVADSLAVPLLVATGLIGMQILFGNIIEPKFTGKTLNLSTLAILINLVIWGMLWGAVGMFLSVPLLVAVFIITAQFDETRWIAVLLSADGEIPAKEED
jgi:predicted PurR-regulated permease PerM